MSLSPERKLVAPERREEDAAESSLRPQRLAEFIGQEQARKNLGVFIAAARGRKEALDHVLFVGPPWARQDDAWRRFSPASLASISAPRRGR